MVDIKRFCKQYNKIFLCKDAYMCNISCPLWIYLKVQSLVDGGASLSESLRQVIQSKIPDGNKKEILYKYLRDYIRDNKEPYPDKGWQQRFIKEINKMEKKRYDEITKGSAEEIRITLDEFNSKGEDWRPTEKGIILQYEQFKELRNILNQIWQELGEEYKKSL